MAMPELSHQEHSDLQTRPRPDFLGAQKASTAEADQPRCVICGALTNEILAEVMDTRFGIPGRYAICRCSRCGLDQIDPRPEPAELKKLYESYYNFEGERATTWARLREWFLASGAYRLWLTLDGDFSFHTRKGSGRLLDVGCNEGRGLTIYRRNGFQPEGLELNEKAAWAARAAGFTVYETLLQDFHPAAAYDVVVLSNVLEHSLDPKRMLQDVARILRPDGQVWISCPNSRSWLRTLFGHSWINWHVPFHIVQFSSLTLRQLLLDTGFTTIEIRQVTPAAWVASSIIVRLFFRPEMRTRQLRNPLILPALMFTVRALFFPILWLANRMGRGDCLVVTTRKTHSTLKIFPSS
jgi:2-polyprenyl-3-methyl-5-hydroxy-6-metoxy-1,4-benzoquinol methylase